MEPSPNREPSAGELESASSATRIESPASSEPAAPAAAQNLDSPELYINRELSLLEFQKRVLDQAKDAQYPLLERVKFLSIVSSNLDEFFMVRVAGLQRQVASGAQDVSADGRTASAQLHLIREEVRKLVVDIHDYLNNVLVPELAREGIRVLDYSQLSQEEQSAMESYFHQHIFPVLTPLAFDPGRPFPHISSRSLNLAVVVGDSQGTQNFARIKIPDTLPRLVPVVSLSRAAKAVKPAKPEVAFVWLEQLIAANLSWLFPGMEILESFAFRVTRDAEVAIQELESDDLLESVEEAMRLRRFSFVVRLQVDENMSERILEILANNLPIDKEDVYRIRRPIGLGRMMELYSLDRPDLKDKPFLPAVPPGLSADSAEDIFSVIRRDDVLLHHPYESFQPVVEFLRQAARDANVLAIKVTLYRVGRNSPIVAALLEAVERGKQVSALVELKARFDEESNIEWARRLEDAGVHVVYGLVGMKVHSKISLVVRREGDAIRRYVHLGTGNYNPTTARIYTDFGFFTCNELIGDDATNFFNALTGYSRKNEPHELLVAPVNLRPRLVEMIEREIALQKKGERGHLIFKMNALEDPEMIRLLYRASQAGVKVDLLVRGLCCLRPGLAGISDNIRVLSIVGRFLEHSRVYYFRNGGNEAIFLGSADLMRRNLSHRVEILFPITGQKLIQRIKDFLEIELRDERKAYHLHHDGRYTRSSRWEQPDVMDSQSYLIGNERAPQKPGRPMTVMAARKRRVGGRPTGPRKV